MTQFDVIDSAGGRALDTVVGGAAIVLDAAQRPRTTARRAQRRGHQATADLQRTVDRAVDRTGLLPERAVRAYLRAVKRQARRHDVVGLVARGILAAVHGPASTWAGVLGRIEREAVLPRRAPRATVKGTARRKASAAVRRTRGATTSAKGRVSSSAGRARATAKRRAGARSARRSA